MNLHFYCVAAVDSGDSRRDGEFVVVGQVRQEVIPPSLSLSSDGVTHNMVVGPSSQPQPPLFGGGNRDQSILGSVDRGRKDRQGNRKIGVCHTLNCAAAPSSSQVMPFRLDKLSALLYCIADQGPARLRKRQGVQWLHCPPPTARRPYAFTRRGRCGYLPRKLFVRAKYSVRP
jgi:hypothetical protein